MISTVPIGGGKDNFGAPNMLLILRPTAMPRTARSAALLDMSASTDSGRTPQAGDPNNLANAIHARLRQRHWDGYRRVMETGKSRYGESDVLSVPAVRKDGMVAIMRDVTSRFNEMRALKRKLAELSLDAYVGYREDRRRRRQVTAIDDQVALLARGGQNRFGGSETS
jgi:hypothetical protein